MPTMWDSIWGVAGDPSAGTAGTGLLGQAPYIRDLGFGLLAGSGPSLAPQGGLGARLGKAGMYASERQQEGLLNDTRRMALSEAAEQRKKAAAFAEAMTGGGDAATIKAAAAAAYPELAAKTLFPQPLDPDTQLRMLEIEQRIAETKAASGTPSAATARSVGNLASVFDTAEKEGNPFAPGEFFSSQGLLAKAGLSAPETVKGLPDSFLKPFGDPATIKRQAGQAILIDKETQAITQNLTQLADKGTGRSATAINNLNTSLGVGNVPIPVRRNAILGALEIVIDDVEGRGQKVEPDWYTLREKLREQTKGLTKGGEEGNIAYGTQSAPGVGYSHEGGLSAQPASKYTTLPPVTVSPPAQAGAGPAAPAPLVPPTPAPAARKVQTTPIDPSTGNPMPQYPRKADGARAVKKGKFVAPNDQGVPTIYEVY